MTDTVTLPTITMANTNDIDPDRLESGTVRIAGDLLEKARFVIFRRTDPRGKRMKMAQYVDSLIRSLIQRDYELEVERMEAEQEAKLKRKKRKED